MNYKSGGSEGKGGRWTSVLCKNLLLDLPITTILDKTCDDVIETSKEAKKNQAPHYISSVGILCLKSWIFTYDEFVKKNKGFGATVAGHGSGKEIERSQDRGDPADPKAVIKAAKGAGSLEAADSKLDDRGDDGKEQSQEDQKPKQFNIDLCKPKLEDVRDFLKDKRANWDDIGGELMVSYGDRHSIGKNCSSDKERLEAVINSWLTKEEDAAPCTWKGFKCVLNEKLQYKDVLREVEIFLKKPETIKTYSQ